MPRKATLRYLVAIAVILAFSPGRILLAADTVPEFKIESCRAAEEGSAARNAQACFQDEQNAKDTLRQNWSTYDPSQKTRCQQLLKPGGMPSYVELLTCIEMKTGPSGPASKKKGV